MTPPRMVAVFEWFVSKLAIAGRPVTVVVEEMVVRDAVAGTRLASPTEELDLDSNPVACVEAIVIEAWLLTLVC